MGFFTFWILSSFGVNVHSYFENALRLGKESSDSEAEDFEHAEKLRHVKAVLEEVNHYFHLCSFCMNLRDCEVFKVRFGLTVIW